MFQLNANETRILLSKNVIANRKSPGGSRPYAFTEQGVAILSSVLSSTRSVQVNIAIMRAFVRMREMLRKIQEMETRYDGQLQEVFEAIRLLAKPPESPRRPIDFVPAR